MKYALVGYGRMGRAIESAAAERGHQATGYVNAAQDAGDREALGAAEVAFEFSTPQAAAANVSALVAANVAVVCGTTGWSPSSALATAATEAGVGVVLAENFSIGVNLFFRIAGYAATELSRAGVHQPFVEEAHHRGKRDAPSGTAKRIARILRESDPSIQRTVHGALDGASDAATLHVTSRRSGFEPGTHVVGFDGPHDMIRLEHRARSREGFALGAVLAAEWVQGRSGLFQFTDVLDEILERSAGESRLTFLGGPNTMSETMLELRGAMTALITPFADDGGVDTDALQALVRWQIDSGIHGLVPCGTTGEGATLDDEEHAHVIHSVALAAEGRVPVVAGCGTNDTRRTIEGARRARDAGADALLVVTPYYNKPNRRGMLEHYAAVARATDRPIVVYNVPGRTGQNLTADLTLELARIPGVVAVKEASADLDQIASILAARPQGFSVLSGDDMLVLPTMALGAEGVISVVSNEAPGAMAELVDAVAGGDYERGRVLHYRLLALMRANFIESNPVPVKTAMALLGHCRPVVRPPLGEADGRTRDVLSAALEQAQIREVSR